MALLIPVLALTIGLAATIFGGLIRLQKTRQREGRAVGGGDDVGQRLEALEEQVGTLQRQLSETQERVDFAERLLTRSREPQG